MKQQPAPDPLFLRLRHAVAEAQLVLFELLALCADLLGAWWRKREWRDEMMIELRSLRQAQAMLVFLAAHARAGSRAIGARRSSRPPNAPRGYSRALYTHRCRTVWRIVPAGRGLRGRIEALRDARDNFDALVARTAKRLRDGVCVAAYVITHAPREHCAALARVEEHDVDTS